MNSKKEDAIFRARQSREGQKGGKTTLKRHGSEFYSKIARKRWANKNGTSKKA